MNYYYEIAPGLTDEYNFPSQYMAAYDARGDQVVAGGYRLTSISTRIWKENNGEVRFVKNRYEDLYDTHGNVTDIEEFFMIKLRAQALR